jgi:hypothetical protein
MTTLTTPDRTLHLVDIENLVGGGVASRGDIDDAFARYLALAHWEPGDLVYVAANPALAREFVFDPPVPCNVHTAHGADGADLALLVHAAPEFVSRRCTRLVIGSGDHIFISRALQVRASMWAWSSCLGPKTCTAVGARTASRYSTSPSTRNGLRHDVCVLVPPLRILKLRLSTEVLVGRHHPLRSPAAHAGI